MTKIFWKVLHRIWIISSVTIGITAIYVSAKGGIVNSAIDKEHLTTMWQERTTIQDSLSTLKSDVATIGTNVSWLVKAVDHLDSK